jgi:ferredoxin
VKDADASFSAQIEEKRKAVRDELEQRNSAIPDYATTKQLVEDSPDEIWFKYAQTCVSCGGCATICPTCTCFLLIDRPGFEKVRQMDACQYPGFARVAAGEDPLRQRMVRFRNRYKCKYVYKPNRFESSACTGCGRCIETCIGGINKNELFVELAEANKDVIK